MTIHDSPDSGSPHSGVVKRTSPGTSEFGPLIDGEGKLGRRYKVKGLPAVVAECLEFQKDDLIHTVALSSGNFSCANIPIVSAAPPEP